MVEVPLDHVAPEHQLAAALEAIERRFDRLEEILAAKAADEAALRAAASRLADTDETLRGIAPEDAST